MKQNDKLQPYRAQVTGRVTIHPKAITFNVDFLGKKLAVVRAINSQGYHARTLFFFFFYQEYSHQGKAMPDQLFYPWCFASKLKDGLLGASLNNCLIDLPDSGESCSSAAATCKPHVTFEVGPNLSTKRFRSKGEGNSSGRVTFYAGKKKKCDRCGREVNPKTYAYHRQSDLCQRTAERVRISNALEAASSVLAANILNPGSSSSSSLLQCPQFVVNGNLWLYSSMETLHRVLPPLTGMIGLVNILGLRHPLLEYVLRHPLLENVLRHPLLDYVPRHPLLEYVLRSRTG